MVAPGRHRAPALALLGAWLLASACGGVQAPEPGAAAGTGPALAWPAPPAPARIRFVRVVTSGRDLGVKPGFWERMGAIVLGARDERFVRPTGVAADGPVLYVADPGAPALWILDGRAGRLVRVEEAAGRPLASPVAVAVGDGAIYLADSALGAVFRLEADGSAGTSLEVPGLERPAGLAWDAARGRLYVADSAAHRIVALDRRGGGVARFGERGGGDGEFNFPTHLAVGRDGTLYVTDALGFRIQRFGPDGTFRGAFGTAGNSSGYFTRPKGVGVDSAGHVYVVEALFDTVQIFDPDGRFLLTFGEQGEGRGQFWLPGGLFVDPQDRIFVADSYNRRVQVFQYVSRPDGG